ncbi:MAG: DNA polymerase III subunit alpha, partial [Lachnospiraceae bacterium]|nr:DNA polymerase III subunit alpha [Lachnospiraceae bacterium]
AMSKKKMKVMEEERANFIFGNEEENIPGAIKNGISEPIANKIFDEMIDFARYAFNKSHAACYAVISYQTAYLKHYYPVEFFAALLNSVKDNTNKVERYIASCKKMGINVVLPDINKGDSRFKAIDGKIMFGLSAIKSVGEVAVNAIISERNANGDFKSLMDFMERVPTKVAGKRLIENFINTGVFDCFEGNRKQKSIVYPVILSSVESNNKNKISGQMTLFDLDEEEFSQEKTFALPNVKEYSKEEILKIEKTLLGVYISGHPLENYADDIKRNCTNSSLDFLYDMEENRVNIEDKASAVIGGMVIDVNTIITRKNEMMAFVTIEDLYGSVELLVFPRIFERLRKYLVEDAKIYVSGRATVDDGADAKFIVDKISLFEDMVNEFWIKFNTMEDYNNAFPQIQKAMLENAGDDYVIIYISEGKKMKRLPPEIRVCADLDLIMAVNAAASEAGVNVETVIRGSNKLKWI